MDEKRRAILEDLARHRHSLRRAKPPGGWAGGWRIAPGPFGFEWKRPFHLVGSTDIAFRTGPPPLGPCGQASEEVD